MIATHRKVAAGGLALGVLLAAGCSGTTSPADLASSGSTPTTVVTTSTARGASGTTSTSSQTAGGRGSTSTTTAGVSSTTAASSTSSTEAGLQQASWGSNVKVTFANGMLELTSDGLPNHARQAEYAVPTAGGPGAVPTAATAKAMADPTRSQRYDFKITTNPTKAASPTKTGGGTIGVMISGAALFNPYEGDMKTVAIQGNFTVKDADGNDVAFLDSCNGHPGPGGVYHYHGLPLCITATIDQPNGPSHLLGVAFDGFPIYGDHDMDGNVITASQLDACNGITSPTPEFPQGIYHYVLLNVPDSTSSIKCFSGTVDPSLVHAAMPGMNH